jgi:multicomponent Na+:H+ antiporter subunit F
VIAWTVLTGVALAAVIPCGLLCVRGPMADRLVGAQLATAIATLAVLLLARAADQPVFVGVALSQALCSFASNLAFVRHLERAGR